MAWDIVTAQVGKVNLSLSSCVASQKWQTTCTDGAMGSRVPYTDTIAAKFKSRADPKTDKGVAGSKSVYYTLEKHVIHALRTHPSLRFRGGVDDDGVAAGEGSGLGRLEVEHGAFGGMNSKD